MAPGMKHLTDKPPYPLFIHSWRVTGFVRSVDYCAFWNIEPLAAELHAIPAILCFPIVDRVVVFAVAAPHLALAVQTFQPIIQVRL